MTLYTDAVFNNGIVARCLDVLIAAREEGASAPALRQELARINRTLAGNEAVSWAMPSGTLTALLDLIAGDLERSTRTLPEAFAHRLTAAAAGQDSVDFLKSTAASLRELQREGISRFDELPMSSWEAELRFSYLKGFSWWVESEEYDDFEAGVLAGVESEHPDCCAERVPPLIAELHTALMLEGDDASYAVLRSTVPWAAPPILREILRSASAHLLDAH
ncbi:hypothetical protein ABZ734_13675 [Streptomyces sp. NPDC006660]|uniref:hypothetical protein n=1 Tax=Streptomyces sp. NPDC006660 TaxID=3156901 RepID=UPI0033D6CEC3